MANDAPEAPGYPLTLTLTLTLTLNLPALAPTLTLTLTLKWPNGNPEDSAAHCNRRRNNDNGLGVCDYSSVFSNSKLR